MTSTILYHSSYHFQSKYRWWMYFCPTFSLILLTSLTCVCHRVCGGQVWSMVPSRLCPPPPTFSSLYMNTTHHTAPWPILPSDDYTRASLFWIGSLSFPKCSQSEWLHQEWWLINPDVKFIITQRLQSDHYWSDIIQTALSIFRNVINNQIELEVVKTDFLWIRIGFPYFVFFLSPRSKFHWHLICEHKIPFKTFMSQ